MIELHPDGRSRISTDLQLVEQVGPRRDPAAALPSGLLAVQA